MLFGASVSGEEARATSITDDATPVGLPGLTRHRRLAIVKASDLADDAPMRRRHNAFDPAQVPGRAAASMRPTLTGTRHMAVAGHSLASHAAFDILESGGNAVDAGVGACLMMGVVQSEFVNIAGVAPTMIRMAETGEVVTIDGLGYWPKAASLDYFIREHDGTIPPGIMRTVIPAAPDAWITALERYGTKTFADVASNAIRVARDGFVMYPLMAEIITSFASGYEKWPANAAIYLPHGKPPAVGELFVQADLASTLQYLADEETAKGGSRQAGLKAARDAFYKGDVAAAICDYHHANGGWLRRADLSTYRVEIETALSAPFQDKTVFFCGPWCQGPTLGMFLKLLANFDLRALGHNSSDYLHTLCEAMKLVFADRERYFTDPKFAPVPLDELLSDNYAQRRAKLIDPMRATGDLPPAGKVGQVIATPDLDTSYVAVVDRDGNAFSCTPSDTAHNAPVIPGTGLVPSGRGSQSWAVQGHPCAVEPGKRPRLTPNPAMLVGNRGKLIMPFGTPGGDVQTQAMLQTLFNLFVFDMPPQSAVEAPRFATYSFPASFEPHTQQPGRLNLEALIANSTGVELQQLGHDVDWWEKLTWRAGGVCLILADLETGVLSGAADPRRACYAVGW